MRTLKLFAFYKGRVALYAILKAMGLKPGDEVILPGFTCVVVPNAIIYLGAKPIFVDISTEDYNIDLDLIEKAITSRSGNIKTIIVQHSFGIPARMDQIMNIAKKYDLKVIEDSCHAIGSKYKGQVVGTWGDAAFFSSQWSKPLTTGIGGWATINNKELEDNMEKIYPLFDKPSFKEDLLLRSQYYIYSKVNKPSYFWMIQGIYRILSNLEITIGSSSTDELESKFPKGYSKRMSPWQKRLLDRKLSEVFKSIEHREYITSLYQQKLKEIGLEPLKLHKDYAPIFLRYPVWVKNKNDILARAKQKRIEIGDWFCSPVHPNLNGWERVGYHQGLCPNAENACQHLINLPTHDRINEAEVDKIIELIAT